MSLSLERQECLAPGEQPGFAPNGNDPADWLSLINPPGGVEPQRQAEVVAQAAAPTSVEVAELVERWVRRVALGGDSRRGVARLDIGEGRYSGAELVVVAEPGHVSVELRLPGSGTHSGLAERVRARLERRGYAAEVVVR